MAISYNRARTIIAEERLRHQDIRKDTGLSNDVLAKLEKDEYMNMESLERLAKYLSVKRKKRLQPSDLYEFKY